MRRRMMFSSGGLPNEYQEVEWIGSNYDAYIITNFIPRVSDSVSFYMQITRYTEATYSSPLYTTNESDNSLQLALLFRNFSGTSYYKYFTNGDASIIGFEFITPYFYALKEIKILSDGTMIFENGSITTEVSKTKTETNAPLYIMARSNLTSKFSGKMGKIEFTRNGTRVFYAIPCYNKTSGVIGMYDLISNTFYTNQGTGTFTKGNDVI